MTPSEPPLAAVRVKRRECLICGSFTAESIAVLANAFNTNAQHPDGWLDQVVTLPICLAHYPQVYNFVEAVRRTPKGAAAMRAMEANRH